MKLFKSKRVKELEDAIFQLQMTISDKNDYICHLKEEVEFLRGRNRSMLEEARNNIFTYKASRYVSKYEFNISEDLIKEDLAETLVKVIMPHLKIEKREQGGFGTTYETRIQILAGENEKLRKE